MKYLIQILIAIDQLSNTIFGGWADETISARCWRRRNFKLRYKYGVLVINALFFWQANHCKSSYESEINRQQIAPEYRGNL